MQNFDYMTPTRLIFGKESIVKLPEVMAPLGKRVLLTYGGGSIKKIGLYDRVMELMKEWFLEVTDYSGRDQVCLPYVLYKNHVPYSFFQENIEKNDFFETWPHNTVEWYIRYWRHVKWFCERHHLFGGFIAYFDDKIKPWLLTKI